MRIGPRNLGEFIVSILVLLLCFFIAYIIGYIQNPDTVRSELGEAIMMLGALSFCILIFVLIFGITTRLLLRIEKRKKK